MMMRMVGVGGGDEPQHAPHAGNTTPTNDEHALKNSASYVLAFWVMSRSNGLIVFASVMPGAGDGSTLLKIGHVRTQHGVVYDIMRVY